MTLTSRTLWVIVAIASLWALHFFYTHKYPTITSLPYVSKSISGFELRNVSNKRTILYFFSSWCGYCHASTESIRTIKQNLQGRANLYAVAWRDRTSDVERFLASKNIQEGVFDAVGLDGTSQMSSKFGIQMVPTLLLLDVDGRILLKISGRISPQDITNLLGLL